MVEELFLSFLYRDRDEGIGVMTLSGNGRELQIAKQLALLLDFKQHDRTAGEVFFSPPLLLEQHKETCLE